MGRALRITAREGVHHVFNRAKEVGESYSVMKDFR